MSFSKPSCSKKRSIDDEHRVFNKKWELQYFFCENNNRVLCLICNQVLAVPKEYNLRRHFQTLHGEKYESLQGQLRVDKLNKLKSNLKGQQSVFQRLVIQTTDNVKVSYILSKLIAENSKPFTDGLFIKECIVKTAQCICPENVNAFHDISLSPNTVASRIDEMSSDIKEQLIQKSTEFLYFSLAIDESTDVTDVAQLAVFIRGVDDNLRTTEELLKLIPMHDTTKAEDIFNEIKVLFEEEKLSWLKLASLVTDGAPAMASPKNGVVGKIKDKLIEDGSVTPFVHFHCILHQGALCGRVLKVENILKPVVKIINYIRSRSLNHRQFTTFLKDIGCEHSDILYHSHIRWLSCGRVLKRFWELRHEIKLFLETKNQDTSLFNDPKLLQDLAFSTDITGYLNDLNIKLQGQNKLINHMIDNVKAFQRKLQLWEMHLKSKNFVHFPTLKAASEDGFQINFEYFSTKISMLKEDFAMRFECFNDMENIFNIFVSPFSCSVDNAPEDIQLELIDFQCDSFLKEKFSSHNLQEFYHYVSKDKYKNIHKLAARVLSFFGTTYCCEQLFSRMNQVKSVERNKLSDTHLSSVLRLACSKDISPNIDKLVSQKRVQVSGQIK